MARDLEVERSLKNFYDSEGWQRESSGASVDAAIWEDLREVAKEYVTACRRRVLSQLPSAGDRILDAASGPVQYPEYLEYSKNFQRRVCVDISAEALRQAEQKIGAAGEYVCTSILELPFPTDSFDAVLSLHTIYHIDKDQQAAAVRQLIRVAKPGSRIVIIYANPRRLSVRLREWFKGKAIAAEGPIYYYAHPLEWWRQFEDSCSGRILPWRFLTAGESRRLIPEGWLGRFLFRAVLGLESLFPRFAVRMGAYPMVVLRKRG